MALKLLDKIWNMLGLVESEDAEDTSPSTSDKPVPRLERKAERPVKANDEVKPRRTQTSTNSEPVSLPIQPQRTPTPPSSSVMATPAMPPQTNGKGQLSITQPTGFDDARQIAENVTNGKTVVVNFERTDGDTTKRTVDFMSGITYAVGGTVQRISSTVFLFAPAHVEVFTSERFSEDEQSMLPWRRS
jgi:cell division inhibitor SepF